MQAGDEVPLIGDPGRRETLTDRETSRGARAYIQVRFPGRTDWFPRDQVEVVSDGRDPAIDLIRPVLKFVTIIIVTHPDDVDHFGAEPSPRAS